MGRARAPPCGVNPIAEKNRTPIEARRKKFRGRLRRREGRTPSRYRIAGTGAAGRGSLGLAAPKLLAARRLAIPRKPRPTMDLDKFRAEGPVPHLEADPHAEFMKRVYEAELQDEVEDAVQRAKAEQLTRIQTREGAFKGKRGA